jgi:hypothetical protein
LIRYAPTRASRTLCVGLDFRRNFEELKDRSETAIFSSNSLFLTFAGDKWQRYF